MSNTEFMDMLDGVLLEIPECPTPVAEMAMRKAAIDWFNDTHAWDHDLPTFVAADGLLVYPVILPECTDLIAVSSLEKADGKPLEYPGWWVRLPNTIMFQAQPEIGLSLTPKAILAPSRAATGAPCRFDRHISTWEHGALAYLRAQASRPWYSINDAERHRAIFRSAIAGERVSANTGRRTGGLRVRPRTF